MDAVNYIQAKEISKSYGEKTLFRGISLSVSKGQKIALIARNGTGKTSLLNILAGQDVADEGECTRRSGLRISYLPQEVIFEKDMTVSEALLSAGNEVSETLREYGEFVLDSEKRGKVVEEKQLQALIEKMDALGAWEYEQKVKQIIDKLRIGSLRSKTDELSGGELRRLALARILVEEHDLLLLDEPTNHLDIDMIEWLESYLSRQNATLVMVTHDRYFLDNVCNEIIEIENGRIFTYKGNYANYLEKKQERKAAEGIRNEKDLKLLRSEAEWMRRSPPARTVKSKARINAYSELKGKTGRQNDDSPGEINMQMKRMGSKILELKGISKSYGSREVISNFSYVFKKGEKAGIAGPNGSGKSTLLSIISGDIMADKGEVIRGETISFGYYRQEGIAAKDDKKVLEAVKDIAEGIWMNRDKWFSAEQFLRYFNFPNHMHNDRISNLSGGEKRRLYLLTILMKNPNFIILDEPTNDLDIETLNLLEDFLAGFNGCLLIVSHDRYFIDRLCDHIFVFNTLGGIKDFSGNFTDYRKQIAATARVKPDEKRKEPEKQKRKKREKTKLNYREQQELEKLEAEISSLEKVKEELIQKMNSGNLASDELIDASERFREVESILDEKSNRWLELSEYS